MTEYITIIEQREGLEFEFVKDLLWVENGFPKEYVVKVVVETDNVEKQISKCRKAWETEEGIFFRYPDFTTGTQRKARIIDANQTPDGNLELEIVLDKDAYDDWQGTGTTI